ncbi:hypothetical protein KIN20_029509 [Parelaphostrongylus tenuis]|uniref:Uncharacterized protein n=1 Tax=Parelaphostrongylus tenuis TaxID=148309 RepID=A0AAD5R3B7_PARTN|nr:hypothetical protein KIN20_029509 [Parelaphostrongylus tenuis]
MDQLNNMEIAPHEPAIRDITITTISSAVYSGEDPTRTTTKAITRMNDCGSSDRSIDSEEVKCVERLGVTEKMELEAYRITNILN